VLALGVSQAQGQARPQESLLLLNDAIATAGQEVRLHLVMGSVSESARRLELELEMPSGLRQFVDFEPVYLAEKVGLQFSLVEETPERVRLAFSLPQGGEESFPEEGLGFLVVKVLEETQPQVLIVKAVHGQLIDVAGDVVGTTSEAESKINVVSAELYPLVSCFFYMH